MIVDPVLDSFKEAIKADVNSKLSYDRLYGAFEKWRKDNGVKTTKERREFIKNLR